LLLNIFKESDEMHAFYQPCYVCLLKDEIPAGAHGLLFQHMLSEWPRL